MNAIEKETYSQLGEAIQYLYLENKAKHVFIKNEMNSLVEMGIDTKMEVLTKISHQFQDYIEYPIIMASMDHFRNAEHGVISKTFIDLFRDTCRIVKYSYINNAHLVRHFSPYYSKSFVNDFISKNFPETKINFEKFPSELANSILRQIANI